MPKCPIHKIDLICFCPACRGAVRSKKKAASSRENGRRGGRPTLAKAKAKAKAKARKKK